MNKYCRICWNTAGWRYPTGAAIETGRSYVAENGFGHEEWLLNFEWISQGYRYGFLQPIGKFRSRYLGDTFSVLLYTLTPDKVTLLVGQIDNLYVPNDDELLWAVDQMRGRGWLNQMIEDVNSVRGNSSNLLTTVPDEIANVRFRPQDVNLFDPRPRVIGDHNIVRIRRYQPLNWPDGDYPEVDYHPPDIAPEIPLIDPRRSELERTRAAQEEAKYDPRHVRLQNRLYSYLVEQFGINNVAYERDFVDISVFTDKTTSFYEIKISDTAKKSIRQAIGQLLEYAHYPSLSRADELIIVGDTPPKQADINYLNYLREKYQIPLLYGYFNWETGALDQIV